MKGKFLVTLVAMCTMLFAFGMINVTAATNGIYTYSVSNGEATITDCDSNASGEIVIPATLDGYPVTSIGDRAFQNCTSIITVTIPDDVTSIGNWAFNNCNKLTSINIPDGVTIIDFQAFMMCSSLTDINIPDGLTTIDAFAFSDCRSLKSIKIPDSVTSIGRGAFSGCNNLASITISDGLTSMGDSVFSYCSSLTSITIPDGITIIDDSMFQNCTNLKNITIPNSVTSIGNNAFNGCSSLTDVYYNGTQAQWNAISINSSNEPLTNATVHLKEAYRINSITIKDMSGNNLQAIPTGTFLATVSFTNVASSADAVIILAEYSEAGTFKGLLYIQTEDVPTGSTIKLSIPVDNSTGDIASLKAFCLDSFGSLTPMCNSSSFSAE